MPSHHHNLKGGTDYVGIDGNGGTAYGQLYGGANYRWKIGQEDVGGGKPHNNLQPYRTLYMWLRIA